VIATEGGAVVWIKGVPKGWHDNFFVRKKLMSSIKNRFENLNINVKEVKKDTSSQHWLLTLGSKAEVDTVIAHTLFVEEGTKKHILTL